jgi:hypothetical protein
LLVHAGEVAGTVEEQSDYALADGRNGLQHRGKEILMDVEDPEVADGVAVCAPTLHAGVRKLSGELRSAADEERDRRGFAAVDLCGAAKDDVHVKGGLAFAK